MDITKNSFRDYLSLLLLFLPAVLFATLLVVYFYHPKLHTLPHFPFLPWQFWLLIFAGSVATVGGVLDWRYHRNPLLMKISKRERKAEASALGLGGLPMFILMWWATIHSTPTLFLIPIVLVLVYTVVAISYDEFVFHIKRCGKEENFYHRMLVFGNGIAWLAWFHFIYVK